MKKKYLYLLMLCGGIGILSGCQNIELPFPKLNEAAGKETAAVQSTAESNETAAETVPQENQICLSQPELSMKAGEVVHITGTIFTDDKTGDELTWRSDNQKVVIADSFGNLKAVGAGTAKVQVSSTKSNMSSEIKVTVESPFNIEVIDGLTYVNGIWIVNKSFSMPEDYNPGVNPEAEEALQQMFAAAAGDGITLWVASGFRPYSLQEDLYNRYVQRDGKEAADRYSARPGYSEHQTGLSFDLNEVSSDFEGTPEAVWLAEHCWEYGFIIRFPKGKEDITGYKYEPWHVRYLGRDAAEAVYKSGLCLEEYLGVTSCYADTQ